MKKQPYNTVLIVDDEPYIRIAYAEGFERAGYRVLTAEDGNDAFLILPDDKPDIILLDIVMPGMDGIEVLTKLKGSAEYKHIPVVIISNLNNTGHRGRALELGAHDFIVKSNHSIKHIISMTDALLLEQVS